jgi:hypothetical protein
MSACQMTRGFFIVRECGDPASDRCFSCGKAVCVEHRTATKDGVRCMECLVVREHPAAARETNTAANSIVDRFFGDLPGAGGDSPTTVDELPSIKIGNVADPAKRGTTFAEFREGLYGGQGYRPFALGAAAIGAGLLGAHEIRAFAAENRGAGSAWSDLLDMGSGSKPGLADS